MKYHPNALFFLILRFLRDLAFQLIFKILHLQTHFKPTETFQYTHFSSCHPSDCKKGRGKALHVQLLHLPQKFHLLFHESHPKTVNIQGYSGLQEPIRTHEDCYPLIWWILILVKFMRQDLWRVYTFWWCSFLRQLYPGTRTFNGTWFTLFPNPNH